MGGLGTRLRSVVADRPKVLALVNGKPFLSYLLDQVAAAGITHTVLCVGYRGEQVQQQFKEEYAGMRLSYSQEESLLGTGGALRLAIPRVGSDTVLVMNGDSYLNLRIGDFWRSHLERGANASMALTHQADTARYGRVSLDPDGKITGFEEKGSTSGQGWINAGLYLVKTEMVRAIPAGRVISLEREVFPTWIGGGFFGYHTNGRFLDIGTPESYAQADELFAGERH